MSRSMLDAADIVPMVTWGTSPEQALPVTAKVPDPARIADENQRAGAERALAYMGLTPGEVLTDGQDRPRLHRLVHQRPDRGSARRRRHRCAARRSPPMSAPWSCRVPVW